MSLEDKFNKNDDGLIIATDKSLQNVHKRMAKNWQSKTKRSKTDLERILYFGCAAFSAANFADTGDPFMFLPTTYSVVKGLTTKEEMVGVDREEMASELLGLPKATPSFLRLGIYWFGVFYTSKGALKIAETAVSGESGNYADAISPLTFGLATLSFATAGYIAKVDAGDPPQRKKKKSLVNKVKDGWSKLRPNPVNLGTDNYSRPLY